jgi:hypothetical protein
VDRVLDAGPLTGPLLAREVAAATRPGQLLVAAASNPVRTIRLSDHFMIGVNEISEPAINVSSAKFVQKLKTELSSPELVICQCPKLLVARARRFKESSYNRRLRGRATLDGVPKQMQQREHPFGRR